jgi:beta-1,4-mannosyltransferase
LWILFSEHHQPPAGAASVVIPQGHYVDWFAGRPHPEPVAGRLLQFGMMRRYKGSEQLLDAFRPFAQVAEPPASLHVVGQPVDEATADAIRTAAARDPRITVVARHVDDDELCREISESELVVLPFVGGTNSSSLMVALSLDRAVLVPDSPVHRDLAAEVGPGWVLTFDGALAPSAIEAALATVRGQGFHRHPDLSARSWPSIGELHASAMRRAIDMISTHHSTKNPAGPNRLSSSTGG